MGDAQATRRRLLAAATREFAEHGIAGARVDRITEAAPANKAQLYAYFGNKESLFGAVFKEHLAAIMDAVPLTGKDLPGYAVALYDDYLRTPELARLAMWARLERVPVGELVPDDEGHEGKVAEIAAAQSAGLVDPEMAPADVLSLVIAMSHAWSPVSLTYAAGPDNDQRDHERRRAALHRAVSRAVAP